MRGCVGVCMHVQCMFLCTQLHTIDVTNLVGVGRGGLKRF